MVHRRTQGLGITGHVHQAQLQVRHQHRPMAVIAGRRRAARPSRRARRRPRRPAGSAAMPSPPMTSERKIDQSAMIPASQVPATMPSPKDSRKIATAFPQSADVGDDRGDVGVDGEHAAEADGSRQQGQPDLGQPECSELAATAGLGVTRDGREEPADEHQGDDAQHGRPPRRQRASRAAWPSSVAAGTPSTLAKDSPSMTWATARPLREGGARPAATRDATPK